MNILDDNSENVLLEKIPFGKIFLIGIGIPIGLTFLIFYYLFDWNISYRPLDIYIWEYEIGVSEFSVLISILFVLIIFFLSSTWVRNISCSRTLKMILLASVIFFLITTLSFAIFGELTDKNWTLFSATIDTCIIEKLPRLFQKVMFFISLTGVFSLFYFLKK